MDSYISHCFCITLFFLGFLRSHLAILWRVSVPTKYITLDVMTPEFDPFPGSVRMSGRLGAEHAIFPTGADHDRLDRNGCSAHRLAQNPGWFPDSGTTHHSTFYGRSCCMGMKTFHNATFHLETGNLSLECMHPLIRELIHRSDSCQT